MRSCCSTPRTAVAGARSATSAQAPCRSTRRSSASATIHISWTCARPTVEPLQRIDAKQECRSLETTVKRTIDKIIGLLDADMPARLREIPRAQVDAHGRRPVGQLDIEQL